MLKADRVASDCQDMEKVYVSSSEELVEISRINANCKLKEENNEESERAAVFFLICRFAFAFYNQGKLKSDSRYGFYLY